MVSHGLCTAQTQLGSILLYKFRDLDSVTSNSLPSSLNTPFNYIPIPDGDFDKHLPAIIHQLTLRKLGCGFYPISVDQTQQRMATRFVTTRIDCFSLLLFSATYDSVCSWIITRHLEQQFRIIYPEFKHVTSLEQAALLIVKQIQCALVASKFLPMDTPIDGYYNTQVQEAVQV